MDTPGAEDDVARPPTAAEPARRLNRARSAAEPGLPAEGALVYSAARGDVAQLEEHRVRIAGVRGSSPLISTIPRRSTAAAGAGPGSAPFTIAMRANMPLP